MRTFLANLFVLLLLGACKSAAPPLNSEQIEARFGSYGVEILEQGATRRVTCLYSIDEGRRRCRTLAVVRFAEEVPEALAEPLAAVRAGSSLGATLTGDGWQVEKINRHLGRYHLPRNSTPAVAAYFALEGGESLALHIYDLDARRGSAVARVAGLMEIHDPAYLVPGDLPEIYSSLPFEPLTPDALRAWTDEIEHIPVP